MRRLEELVAPLVANGLTSVLLFGVITSTNKTPDGSFIFAPHSPIPRALKLLASKFPQLLLAVDVCLCGYTDHGHCGILKADKSIDNQARSATTTHSSICSYNLICMYHSFNINV